MADVESLFEFVHMEIVAYFLNKPGKNVDNDVIQNLERLGFGVGQRLVERFTKDSGRFKDELEIMKYICKDFWTAVYKKQIDNLRTNHQGTYVLQDNNFQLLTQMSDGKQYTEDAPKFLAFPCGLIRGALSNLGLTCSVSADVLSMPKCKLSSLHLHWGKVGDIAALQQACKAVHQAPVVCKVNFKLSFQNHSNDFTETHILKVSSLNGRRDFFLKTGDTPALYARTCNIDKL